MLRNSTCRVKPERSTIMLRLDVGMYVLPFDLAAGHSSSQISRDSSRIASSLSKSRSALAWRFSAVHVYRSSLHILKFWVTSQAKTRNRGEITVRPEAQTVACREYLLSMEAAARKSVRIYLGTIQNIGGGWNVVCFVPCPRVPRLKAKHCTSSVPPWGGLQRREAYQQPLRHGYSLPIYEVLAIDRMGIYTTASRRYIVAKGQCRRHSLVAKYALVD